MRGIKPDFRAVALLLPLLLASCAHKKQQAQVQPPLAPPIEDIPPQQPNNAPANLPPPVVTVPQSAQPAQRQPSTASSAAQKQPPKPVHHHRKPAIKPDQAPANAQQAGNGVAPEVSAIGQLSSGDPSDLRRQSTDSVNDTEQKLDKIHRRLSASEQKTVAQIRQFLKQARAALTSGDTDGAYTLALKAKVLLDELLQ